jgi:uncharacterized membrane protein YphA (DoxX/SURF4 family)
LVQGVIYLGDGESSTVESWIIASVAVLAGSATAIGFVTPISSALVAVCAGLFRLWRLPPAAPNLFDATLPAILVVVIAAGIVLLGPGALSVDARLFGRREIIIPPSSRHM